jgi:DNA topoisomerase-1
MRGRYGPYVTDGTTNATIPRDTDPLGVTLDQAASLIADKAAKGGNGAAKKSRRKAAGKPPSAAKSSGKQRKTNGKPKRTPVGAESG